MKKEELKMDRIFREKLEGHSEMPPAHLWNALQGQLSGVKRKKLIAFYSRIAAAAVIILAFLAGWYINEKSDTRNTETVQNEKIEKYVPQEQPLQSLKDETTQNKKFKDETITSKPEDKIDSGETKKVISREKDKSGSEGKQFRQSFENDLLAGNENNENREQTAVPPNPGETTGMKKLPLLNAGNSEEKAAALAAHPHLNKEQAEIAEYEKNRIAENVRSLKKTAKSETGWKMGINVAPGYASHVSSHSASYAQNMVYSNSEGAGNVSGGISVQYKTGGKWRVESGVYYAQNGQKSGSSMQFLSFSSDEQSSYYGAPLEMANTYTNAAVKVAGNKMAMNSAAGIVEFNRNTAQGAIFVSNPEADNFTKSDFITSGEFSQVFDFVEIPLLLRYLLFDKTLGMELVGGINAGVVVGNNAYVENGGSLQNVGKTKDISMLNFSGTVGVGMNYSLGKHVSVAVEPRLNYFLSSINSNPDVDYRPYRIGVYTGVYYEF